jgi:predicted branched-subunit amino acid permease
MAHQIRDDVGMPTSVPTAATSEHIVAPAGRRARIVAGITDSFSAGLGIFPFGIALGLLVMQLHLPWWVAPALSLSVFAGSLVGVLVARLLPGPIKGLEFALCALFTVLTLDAFRSRREIPSSLLAGVSIGTAVVVAPRVALFVAMLIFVGLLLLRYVIDRRHTRRSANA